MTLGTRAGRRCWSTEYVNRGNARCASWHTRGRHVACGCGLAWYRGSAEGWRAGVCKRCISGAVAAITAAALAALLPCRGLPYVSRAARASAVTRPSASRRRRGAALPPHEAAAGPRPGFRRGGWPARVHRVADRSRATSFIPAAYMAQSMRCPRRVRARRARAVRGAVFGLPGTFWFSVICGVIAL